MVEPLKLTPEVRESLVQAVRLGALWADAATAAGVSRQILTEWRRVGREAQSKRPRDRSQRERECVRLINDLTQAEARVAARLEQVPNALVLDDTGAVSPEVKLKAAAFWLKHRRPDTYGDRQRVEVGGTDGGPIQVTVSSEEVWQKVQRLRDERALRPVTPVAALPASAANGSANGHQATG